MIYCIRILDKLETRQYLNISIAGKDSNIVLALNIIASS